MHYLLTCEDWHDFLSWPFLTQEKIKAVVFLPSLFLIMLSFKNLILDIGQTHSAISCSSF